MAWLRDRERFIMQMEMFITAILLGIELMAMDFISMLMGNDMKEKGLNVTPDNLVRRPGGIQSSPVECEGNEQCRT